MNGLFTQGKQEVNVKRFILIGNMGNADSVMDHLGGPHRKLNQGPGIHMFFIVTLYILPEVYIHFIHF